MSNLHRVKELIDEARERIVEAENILSMTDPMESSIGGALSVIDLSLNAASEVADHIITISN